MLALAANCDTVSPFLSRKLRSMLIFVAPVEATSALLLLLRLGGTVYSGS
jgi:hypothetical protein